MCGALGYVLDVDGRWVCSRTRRELGIGCRERGQERANAREDCKLTHQLPKSSNKTNFDTHAQRCRPAHHQSPKKANAEARVARRTRPARAARGAFLSSPQCRTRYILAFGAPMRSSRACSSSTSSCAGFSAGAGMCARGLEKELGAYMLQCLGRVDCKSACLLLLLTLTKS
jgi:hypothetical protein